MSRPFFPPPPTPPPGPHKPGQPLPVPPSGAVQYIGARYVPVFANPLEWSPELAYEPMTIVVYNKNSYTSRIPVPPGILPTNDKYWAMTGQFNAQLEELSGMITGWDDKISENTATAEKAEQTADEALKLVQDATADYTTIKTTVEQHETRLNDVESLAQQNADEIATNTAEISKNTTNIAANTSAISGLTANLNQANQDISKNAADITAQGAEITALKTNMTAAQQDITDLDRRVSANETSIATNTAAIGRDDQPNTIRGRIKTLEQNKTTTDTALNALTGRVTNNEQAITTLTADVSQNATDIAANETEIGLIKSRVDTAETDITGLQTTTVNQGKTLADHGTRISDLETDVAALETTTAQNTSDIVQAQADIKSTNSNLTALTTRVTDLEQDTGALQTTTADHEKRIAANETAITGLQGQTADIEGMKTSIQANADAIAANTKSINDNNTAQMATTNALAARVTANEGSITKLQQDLSDVTGVVNENTGEINDIKAQSDAATAEVNRLSGIIGTPAEGETPATGLLKEFGDLKEAVESGESVEALAGRVGALETNVGKPADGETPATGLNLAVANNTAEIETLKQQSGQIPADVTQRLESLETAVGDSTSGLVKDVTENMGDIATLQADVAEIQAQQTAQDTAISGNTTAIDNVRAVATAALPKSGGTMSGTVNMNAQVIRNAGSYQLNSSASAVKFTSEISNQYLLGMYSDTHSEDIAKGTKIIAGVANPKFDHDAANKEYVDSEIATAGSAYLPLAGGNMTGALNMAGKAVTGASYYSINSTASAVQFTSSLTSQSIGLSPYTSDNDKVSYLKRLVGLGYPTNNHDAATKAYVDNRFVVYNSRTVSSFTNNQIGIWGGGSIGLSNERNGLILVGSTISTAATGTFKDSVLIGCVIDVTTNCKFDGCVFSSCCFQMGAQGVTLSGCRFINCKKSSSATLTMTASSVLKFTYDV